MSLKSGVWTALITPFRSDGKLDKVAFRRLIESQIKAGVSGIVPCGTTGETPTLSESEKKYLIQESISATKGTNTQVIAGTGTNATQSTVEFSKWAKDCGVNGLLVVVPYYNRPSRAGLIQHFKMVSESVDCEIMLYNVPSRTGTNLDPSIVLELSNLRNINAIKDASGGLAACVEISREKRENFQIFSGDDSLFLPMLSVGAAGVVSVASNVYPKEMNEIWELWSSGATADAKNKFLLMSELFERLFIESNPSPVKFIAAKKFGFEATLRLPLVEVSSDSKKILETLMDKMD